MGGPGTVYLLNKITGLANITVGNVGNGKEAVVLNDADLVYNISRLNLFQYGSLTFVDSTDLVVLSQV